MSQQEQQHQQIQHLTKMVEALVSNGKVKTELQQASEPKVSARVQKGAFPAHILHTPQVRRPDGATLIRKLIDRTNSTASIQMTTKKDMDQLRKIQNEYRDAIPKLVLAKDAGTANFEQWNSAFLAYIEILHPDLFQVCKTVSGMDFSSDAAEQPDRLPELPPAIPDLTVLWATSAIKNTVSSEWKHLIETCGTHELLPAYSALVQKFSPNSDLHRSALLADFWTRNILDHEDIDHYAAELVKLSNDVNTKMGTEHIKTIDIISNLKRGLTANANRCDDYKTALQTLNFHRCDQLNQVVRFLKKHCNETPSATPRANTARWRGGGSRGGRGRGRGRGRGGLNPQLRNNRRTGADGSPSWSANFKDTYIVSKDADGQTLVGKGQKITNFCKEALCFTLLQEGKCDDPDCRYQHEFNVAFSQPPQPARSTAVLQLSEESANTAQAQQQEPAPPQPSPPASVHEVPQAHHATIDNYPRYSDDGYSPRGYAATLIHTEHKNEKIRMDNISCKQKIQFGQYYTRARTLAVTLIIMMIRLLCFPGHLLRRLGSSTVYACTAGRSNSPSFPIIEDSGANRNMSPDRSLFVGPLTPLAQSKISTAEGSQAAATHSGTIQLDGHRLPCLYVPSFKQTMLAKSYFVRQGYICSTDTHGRTSYTHPTTQTRFDFQLSNDDLFHWVPQTTCLNSL
jgi:hypothetical protein